jgi:4'-phosphopantetheinyl transferase
MTLPCPGAPAIWAPPAEWPGLPGSDIHVWRVSLSAGPEILAALRPLLAEDERQRAGRILLPDRGTAFLVARGALRRLLGWYLGLPPVSVTLGYTAHGKPFLAGPGPVPPLRFNVSHSGQVALLAFRLGREIGVDVEEVRTAPDLAGIARRFFTPVESAGILSLPPAGQPDAFYACWTRKEAYLKAIGKGIAAGVASVEIFTAPDGRPALRTPAPEAVPLRDWTIRDLPAGEGYFAALAAEGFFTEIRCWECPPGA